MISVKLCTKAPRRRGRTVCRACLSRPRRFTGRLQGVGITQSSQDIDTSCLCIENHLVTGSCTGCVVLLRCTVTKNTPLVVSNVVHPEVIQALLSVPASKEIYHVVDRVDAHGVAAPRRWHITICIRATKTLPDRVGLASVEVGIK